MRRPSVFPVVAALASALLLSGCAVHPPTLAPSPSPSPSPTATDEPCAEPGEASDAVIVRGDLGAEPEIVADGPFDVDRVERTVLVEGEGDPVQQGDLVAVAFTMVNATSGDRSPGTATVRVLLDDADAIPGLVDTIVCSSVGSRVVGVVPAESAFGSAGQPDLGIGPGDDVVFVVDVLELVPLQASGTPVALPDGFPLDIDFDAEGRPTIAKPSGDPPGALTSAMLIEGDGPVVGADDEFLVQFQAIVWATGKTFDETWGDAPRSLLHVLPGVDSVLVGSTVGSRIVVICPPGDAFGAAGSPSSGIGPADTVVYVVDILATTPPPA